ncbi:MAG: hypothetical protein ACHQF4_10160 [Sphingobacteriales bacterium]
MKKKNLLIIALLATLVFVALYSFKTVSTPPPVSPKDLGTIVASVLEYDKFAIINGDPAVIDPKTSKWIPADGRNITNSDLAGKTGILKAPDLRGRFLRGLNTFFNNGQPPLSVNSADTDDPSSNRKAGDFQDDELKSHSHTVNDNSASFAFRTAGMGIQSNNGQQVQFGKPNISINPTGGSETRPKNIAVYYYIKIN